MKIMTSVEAVPSRVLGLLNILHSAGDGQRSRKEVDLLLAPPFLPRKKNSTADSAEGANTDSIVAAAVELQAVEVSGTGTTSVIRLSRALQEARGPSTIANCFPRFAARAALAPTLENSPNAFARACAWLLLQDPLRMPQGRDALKQRLTDDGFELDEYQLRNDSRWDMLLYWTKYLGLAWQMAQENCVGVVPDPSTFIVRHSDTLLPRGEIAIHQFRDTLGKVCPVLDGGSVRRDVLKTMVDSKAVQAGQSDHLSRALSLALRGLKERGMIEYWCPDDQRTFLLFADGEKVAFLKKA